jgi:hypothetical protein
LLEKCDPTNVVIAQREPSTFQIKSRGIAQCIQRKNSQKLSAIKNSRANFKNSSANFRTQEELQQIQNSITFFNKYHNIQVDRRSTTCKASTGWRSLRRTGMSTAAFPDLIAATTKCNAWMMIPIRKRIF